jgi:rhamnulokinase
MLGTLQKGELKVSEICRLSPSQGAEDWAWDIAGLHRTILDALRAAAGQDEPVDSVSCHSSAAPWLLFDSSGNLIAPACQHEGRTNSEPAIEKILARLRAEDLYAQSGIQSLPDNPLAQIAAESARRLNRASRVLPLADGLNYLLGGEPRAEETSASSTQLYNPRSKAWSDRLIRALDLPRRILPAIVPSGTVLGKLRPDAGRPSGLAETKVIASCSHEIAAAIAGLPAPSSDWAYLRPGASSLLGTVLDEPFINESSRMMGFSNVLGYGGSICFHRQIMGTWIFDECQRFWREQDRGLDADVLTHLATSAPPFEALINPADARFATPGDMPLKIQAFCRETNQEVPRKPGSIVRCVLESLALCYRKALVELQYLSGRSTERLFLLGESSNRLLNHFIANALQLPVVIVPEEAAWTGNVLVQAIALNHIHGIDQARELARKSMRMETILPHAAAWHAAFDRFAELSAA